MAENKRVSYTLIYEGGSKSTHATTINMDGNSYSEAERKIRGTNNLTSNVKQVIITEVR